MLFVHEWYLTIRHKSIDHGSSSNAQSDGIVLLWSAGIRDKILRRDYFSTTQLLL